MNDHTQLIARVAGRNPVPNLDDPPIGAWEVDVVRAQVTERDEKMMTDERQTDIARPAARQRGGWRVALATFVIVLMAGGGLWFASRGSESDVAGQPPTTNAPSNEVEQVALDTLVAKFTVDEATFRALATTDDSRFLESKLFDLLLEGAMNLRTDSIACSAEGSVATCEMAVKSDLLDVFGIDESPVTTEITVADAGWTDIVTTGYPRATPRIDAWIDDMNPDLFADGGVCQRPLEIPQDCAEGMLADARQWVADNG